jgi:hypothetical protein
VPASVKNQDVVSVRDRSKVKNDTWPAQIDGIWEARGAKTHIPVSGLHRTWEHDPSQVYNLFVKALYLTMFLLLGGCSPNRTPEKGYLISRYTQISDKNEPEFTILWKNLRHENLRITAACQPSVGINARPCGQLKRSVGTVIPDAKMFSVFSNTDKSDLGYVETLSGRPELLVYNPNGLFDGKGHFNHCNGDCEFLGISNIETVK